MNDEIWTCEKCKHVHGTWHVREWWLQGNQHLFCPHCLWISYQEVYFEPNFESIQKEFSEHPQHAFDCFVGASMFGKPEIEQAPKIEVVAIKQYPKGTFLERIFMVPDFERKTGKPSTVPDGESPSGLT